MRDPDDDVGASGCMTKFQFASMQSRRSSYVKLYKRRTSFQLMDHRNSTLAYRDIMQLRGIDLTKVPWWTSYRLRYAMLWFFGLYCLYGQRVNLSITIVSMVEHPPFQTNATINAKKAPADICPFNEESLADGEFQWNKHTQAVILGAPFVGLMTLQIPGGRLSEHFGAKKVIACGMIHVAITNLLTPLLARWNLIAFIASRFLLGVAESVVHPSSQAFWAKWAPPLERSRLIGIAYAGGQLGNAIIFPYAGYLAVDGFHIGWPSVFYVNGIFVFLWCVVWCVFVHDSPENCPNITLLELRYIQISIGKKISTGPKKTPWAAFFRSKAVWAIIIVHFCSNYTAFMLITAMPTYMREVLKFNLKSNGNYSMLPYLLFWLCIIFAALLADFIIARRLLSITCTRKIMTLIGNIGSGIFLFIAGYMTCHERVKAVAMLTCAVGMCGYYYSGFYINHGDIAPAFAGTLFGITNTIATLSGILAPLVTGTITAEGTHREWQQVFTIASGMCVFGSLVYAVLGEGDVKEWAIYDGLLTEESDMGLDMDVLKEETESEPDGDSMVTMFIPF